MLKKGSKVAEETVEEGGGPLETMCSSIMKEKGQRAARKSMTDFEN